MAEEGSTQGFFGDMAPVEYISRDGFKKMVMEREGLVTENAGGEGGEISWETAAFLIGAPVKEGEKEGRIAQFDDFRKLYPPIDKVQQKSVYYYTSKFMDKDKSGTGIGLYEEMEAFFKDIGRKAHQVIVVFNGHGEQAQVDYTTKKKLSGGMSFRDHKIDGEVEVKLNDKSVAIVPVIECVPVPRFIEDIKAIADEYEYPKYMDVVLGQCFAHEGLDATPDLTEPQVTGKGRHYKREQTIENVGQTIENVGPKEYKVTCFTRYGERHEETTHNINILGKMRKHRELGVWAEDVAKAKEEEEARARAAEISKAPGAPDPPGPFQTTGDGQPMDTD